MGPLPTPAVPPSVFDDGLLLGAGVFIVLVYIAVQVFLLVSK